MENNNLTAALVKVQQEMGMAGKTGYNPHFRSNFSTLEDLIHTSRPYLTKYGLAVTQYPDSVGDETYLVTKLKHISGQEEISRVRILLKDNTDVQKLGSAISYLKRYTYASICGIATSDDDDDGNSLSAESNDYTKSTNNNGNSATISDAQAKLLRFKLKGNKEREEKILAHYQIDSLEELPKKHMSGVLEALEKQS